MVEILSDKCIGCGLCAEDCPAKNLAVAEGKAKVRGKCMECGHCFAVCPKGAVQITDYPADGIIEFGNEVPMSCGDELLNLIKSRRSIRNYQDRKVEKEVLMRVLEAGRFTATAVNSQDVKYTIIQDELESFQKDVWDGFYMMLSAMKKMQGENSPFALQLQSMWERHEKNTGKDPLFFNAPALLIITSSSALNGGLASSNIELMANAEGLGVLFSGFIQRALAMNDAACEALGIRKEQICSCMLMGYPAVKYQRSVPRKETNIQWR